MKGETFIHPLMVHSFTQQIFIISSVSGNLGGRHSGDTASDVGMMKNKRHLGLED